tara:strand:+ start:209 stop:1288 length:1080 start_codon:yes stop_codon:yes gene_type:complete
MASIIQIRRDTASAWTSANPTLAQGELGLETDTSKLKSGDGTTAWTSLTYYSLGTVGYLASTGGALTGAITTNSTFDGRDVSVDGTKLDGIATNANNYTLPAGIATETYVGTQVSNLVDSSPAALNTLNELAAALGDDANFSTTITNSIATKLPLSGGAMTGAITTNSTFDGRDVSVDGTKLDGIEASADVTDATNVAAAGALMDSEVTNLASVKAFDTTDYATSTQGTTADAALPKAGGTMSGLVNMADQIVQRPLLQDYSEKTVAMGSATAVNLEDGNVFSKTISGTTTLTFTNPSSVGTSSFSLILTNGGSATLNFPTTKWAAGTAPTLTASGIDILIFVYHGSTWYGIASGIGMA